MTQEVDGGVERQLEAHWEQVLEAEGLGVVRVQGLWLEEDELTAQELDELDTLMTGREHVLRFPEEDEG